MAVEGASPNFGEMQLDLEEQELQAPGGVGSPQLYNQLLALYLLHNEMCQAKFLWKRIPTAVKSTTPELTTIWAAGQKMWQRDYTGSYEALKKEYSTEVKPIMEAALEAYRRRAFHLVSQAYSSINADELATFLGMPTSEAVQAAQAEGWDADVHTRFITPKKPVGVKPDPEFKSDQQLSILTDYVSFLES
ncbi:COP9 signalosome complex subunit 8-like [Mizuhopecten yessoensis]|uniref:COP9 signalosome complex subunit 8 n=1 Tax=Mizuhopecten yessoensis TaxID=6573 RepID=A0A210Q6K6_MIZYE|nr:COP9 signalosome complex subunit 8-like [Mizuhopecten yessoensis]OWF44351.1 COP9 signalosome complex subunit 8 [Mizuhopecten yessoensis]